MEMVQVKLTRDNKYIIVWLEKRKGIKKGNHVTLKDLPGLFEIVEVFHTMDSSLIHTDWDNNFRGKPGKIFEGIQ